MFVSEKQKLIFIHIPKTAGTSLRTALESKYSNDAKKLIKPEFAPAFAERVERNLPFLPPHLSLNDAIKVLNVDIPEFNILVSVRNPWERLISFFNYVTKVNEEHAFTSAAKQHGLSRTIEYLIKDEKNHLERFPQHFFYSSSNPNIKLHFLRTECLSYDIDHFTIQTGIKIPQPRKLNTSSATKEKLAENIQHLIAYHELPTIKRFSYTYDC